MKLDDIPFVIHDMIKEMPMITDNHISMKSPFSQRLPKDFKKECLKLNDNFLNNYLHSIEEIAHIFPNHDLPKWFKNYQNLYFKAGLSHDGFFKNTIDNSGYFKGTHFRQHNNPFFLIPHVNGATITAGDASSNGSFGLNQIEIFRLPNTGIVGQYYDEVAINILSGSGNYRLGVYNDSGSYPNTLYAQTGSTSISTGFNYLSLTEFALTTTQNYIGKIADSTITQYYLNNAGLGGRLYGSQTYGALPNPATASLTSNDALANCKISHT